MTHKERTQQDNGHRPGTRPPFPEGNAVQLGHGARSPRVYGTLAEQFTAGLLEARPDLAAYPEAVAGWATAEAQATLLGADRMAVSMPEAMPRTVGA